MNDSNKSDEIKDNWGEYEAYLKKLCGYKLKDRPECVEDCMQDIYIAYRQALVNGVIIQHEKAWLTKTACHIISDKLKQEAFMDKNFVDYDDEHVSLFGEEPYAVLLCPPNEEILRMKDRILAAYSPEERSLIEDRYTHNMSGTELAEKYKTGIKNIYVRLYRLRKKIDEAAKQELEQYYSDKYNR